MELRKARMMARHATKHADKEIHEVPQNEELLAFLDRQNKRELDRVERALLSGERVKTVSTVVLVGTVLNGKGKTVNLYERQIHDLEGNQVKSSQPKRKSARRKSKGKKPTKNARS